jgi:hypothetical protein
MTSSVRDVYSMLTLINVNTGLHIYILLPLNNDIAMSIRMVDSWR